MVEEVELEELVGRLVDAWNRRDAASFAALFTPDADYVTRDGLWVRGRDSIRLLVNQADAMGHASIVSGPSIRSHGAVASVTFRWLADDGTAHSRGVTTCVLTRAGRRWLIERLQTTDEKARE